MKLKLTILQLADNVERTLDYEWLRDDGVATRAEIRAFFEVGHASCDCHRAALFAWAGDRSLPDPRASCGEGLYGLRVVALGDRESVVLLDDRARSRGVYREIGGGS